MSKRTTRRQRRGDFRKVLFARVRPETYITICSLAGEESLGVGLDRLVQRISSDTTVNASNVFPSSRSGRKVSAE